MEFRNFNELVDLINTNLGSFCNEFGSKRKELANLARLPKRDILFKYDTQKDKVWAINEGGGTEIQYHIAFDNNELEIRYGLGFNTQYVPFANEQSPVAYMQPFINSFLRNENKIRRLLPDYNFVYGDIEKLKNPQNNEYTLWGKIIKVGEKDDVYIIQDTAFNEIINDLKKQFGAYQIIFKEKNNSKIVTMDIQNSLNVLIQKKQIILQGPPGTGKTYTAKDIAEQIIFSTVNSDKKRQKELLESTDQFKIIQFHPAYSYEDFVRGIVARSSGNFIDYTTENKILASFAKLANENYVNNKKPISEYSEEKWVNEKFSLFCDEIQETITKEGSFPLTTVVSIKDIESSAFRYKGIEGWTANGNRMLFKDIKQAYIDKNTDRQSIKHNEKLSGLARHHASYYIRVLDSFREFLKNNKHAFTTPTDEREVEKKFVLIIDEINRANLPAVLGELIYALEYRGEKVESMYSIDEDNTIIIPPNLFIIGTMNTSDRSVGHIDYAIRRRFAFIDVLPKIIEDDRFEHDLFKKVSSLFIKNFDEYNTNSNVKLIISEHLSEEFRPEDVWLGHSYFIKDAGDFDLRKKYEIIPILKEYIKDGILKQSAEEIIDVL